jgi:hypothetical protein
MLTLEESKKYKWKSEKLLTLALKSFWLIYKSSNFSKYFGVDAITILIVPKEQSFNIDIEIRGGSRGGGGGGHPAPPPKIEFVLCAPPPNLKILDPPLDIVAITQKCSSFAQV